MLISKLLEKTGLSTVRGEDVNVTGVIYDSRKAEKGSLFVCIVGTARDSHDYIGEVIEKGASALVIDDNHEKFLEDGSIPANMPVIVVRDTRIALAKLSASWFSFPSEKMTMIGITGTKGKTTTSYMIRHILEKAGFKVGVIGTIGAVIDGEVFKTGNTTPESYELQKLFADMVSKGCTHCVMEVSSQGLKMNRTAGITFDVGIFTNFSADHIGPGEHESMEEYLYCKSLLFRQCRTGLFNKDDEAYEEILKGHTCFAITYGFAEDADICASSFELTKRGNELGVSFLVDAELDRAGMHREIRIPIPGKFNVYNGLCALSLGMVLGIDSDVIAEALMHVSVKGRVEMVPVSGPYSVMIDYAHNELSVESLLTTVKAYNPNRIICVYGGGGNRAKIRRYAMGELCGKMADLSILTTDNPRDEEVSSINEDIKVGLSKSNGKYIEIEDRKEAIYYAMDNAKEGDLIILLGKGHEEYQEIKGVKYHYSERETVESYEEDRKQK